MKYPSDKMTAQSPRSWEKLAMLLSTSTGRETMLLLRQLGFLNHTEIIVDNPVDQRNPLAPQPIGPWRASGQGSDLKFVRENKWDKYLWLEKADVLYANKEESTFRVCLIGESVAAGMFFSPHVNPAKVLNSILNQVKPEGAKNTEVIDLSRNAMRIDLLMEVVDAAPQLNPDVIVVFAGNNFCRLHTVGRPDFQGSYIDLSKEINENGPLSLFDYFLNSLEKGSYSAIEKMAKKISEKGVELIWVLPTVCKTWQRMAPVIWLGEGKTARWHQHLRKAISALDKKEYQKALDHGKEMESLDRGTCSTSQRVLANAYLGLDRKGEATQHCRREVDVDCALQRNSFLAPGIQSVVGKVIKELAHVHEFKVIDLEAVFAEYADNPILDSKLFVDYCHLTIEGMEVAMAAVASSILGEEAREGMAATKKKNQSEVDPKVIARGLFEATIYTSHMQQCLELDNSAAVLKARFVEVLTLSKCLAETMFDYVGMRGGSVVTELSSQAHKIVASANSLLDFGILQWIHGVDSPTIEAICGALEDNGYAGDELLKKYQQYDISQLNEGVDLTAPRYLKYFGRDGLVDWSPERGTYRTQPYLRSFWPQLPLVFAANAGSPIECKLTCRVPSYVTTNPSCKMGLKINGSYITDIPLTRNWNKSVFSIDGRHIKQGFNEILLEWPDLQLEENDIINETVHRLEVEGQTDWYPVFGEVFSFLVKSSK